MQQNLDLKNGLLFHRRRYAKGDTMSLKTTSYKQRLNEMHFGHEMYVNAVFQTMFQRDSTIYSNLIAGQCPGPHFVSFQRMALLRNQQTIKRSQTYVQTEFSAVIKENLHWYFGVHTSLFHITVFKNKMGEFLQVSLISITFIQSYQ